MAKKSAQAMAKQQLVAQQKQAMQRQSNVKGNTLDAFFSKEKKDDDSIDSDDEDMFSFLQWSAHGSEHPRRSSSVGRAGRSRSAPRIRLSSSLVSLLSDSKAQATERRTSASKANEEGKMPEKKVELKRSISVPKTREDLEKSMSSLQAANLFSLYGMDRHDKVSRSKSVTKDESKQSQVIQPEKRKPISSDGRSEITNRSKDDEDRSGSRVRSVRQFREEEASRHKSSRKTKDSDDTKSRHKSSRMFKDSDDKSSRHKSSRRLRDSEERGHRNKSSRRIREASISRSQRHRIDSKDSDDKSIKSRRHKSSRRVRDGEKHDEGRSSRRNSKDDEDISSSHRQSSRRMKESEESSRHRKSSHRMKDEKESSHEKRPKSDHQKTLLTPLTRAHARGRQDQMTGKSNTTVPRVDVILKNSIENPTVRRACDESVILTPVPRSRLRTAPAQRDRNQAIVPRT